MSLLRTLLLGALCVFLVSEKACAQNQISKAIDSYQAGIAADSEVEKRQFFETAEQLFSQSVENENGELASTNPSLLVNLGNASLQTGRTGNAIWAYRVALSADPGNSVARQNLGFARDSLPEWIKNDRGSAIAGSLFFWVGWLPAWGFQTIAALAFSVGLLCLCFGFAKSSPLLKQISLLPFFVWLVLIIGLVGSASQSIGNTVVVEETTLFSADSENSPPRISKPIPGGAEVSIIQDRERWVEVQLPGDVSGWVLKSKTKSL